MKEKNEIHLLYCIGSLYENSEKSELKSIFFEKNKIEIDQLSAYLKVTKNQAFLMAIIFTMNYKGDTVDYNDLMDYFSCNPMKILEFKKDFDLLHDKGYLLKKKSKHRASVSGANDQYTVNEDICSAILDGEPLPEIKTGITDVYEFLEKMYELGQQRDKKEITTSILVYKANNLLRNNDQFPLVKKVNTFELKTVDKALYFYLIWKTLSGRDSSDLSVALEGIIDKSTRRVNLMQDFQLGKHPLIELDLIELLPASFMSETEMKLTDKSNDLLKECGIFVFKKKINKKNIIEPKDIATKKLIFSTAEMKQLYLLQDVLKPEQFKKTQRRLNEKNLPQGIAALLHGAPGTGKTEVVKQIAKETNRELMKVDISESKSKWFGESQKVVKKIFTDYKALLEENELAPILFLNEADAIISKRGTIGNSSLDKTENAIQNILLEELENFEGILIATTNLPDNLDAAFERRFLFKILFHPPTSFIRAEIWKSKLPGLSDENCNFLADKFNFSGGQIDNIIRKSEINEIIHGEEVSLENLLVFCSEETFTKHKSSIGFTNRKADV